MKILNSSDLSIVPSDTYPELHHLMVAAAKDATDLHTTHQFFLFKHQVQQITRFCWFLDHLWDN